MYVQGLLKLYELFYCEVIVNLSSAQQFIRKKERLKNLPYVEEHYHTILINRCNMQFPIM